MTNHGVGTGSDAGRDSDLMLLIGDVVAAFVGNNAISASELPELIRTVHGAFVSLGQPQASAAATVAQRPAVPASKSITTDYIICLEDGKKLKMLKRYLRTQYGLSPEDYRRKWKLPADYPMVAPAYAERRSNFAKEIGLGRGVRKKPLADKIKLKKAL